MGILICGLNGSGKSTLGRMLADRIGYEFIDNEDLFFPKTDEEYVFSGPRSKEEAIRLLEEKISKSSKFVFAAVKGDYGEKLIASLDQIVLIDVPKEIRSQRVRERSFGRFGERIKPGGDLYDRETAWFSLTDSRPEDYTTKWLETVDCPVIRVDGTLPVEENIGSIMSIILTGYPDAEPDVSNSTMVRKQYSTPDKLNTRISIHRKYSTNKQGFGNWITSHYQIQEGMSVLELGCGTGEMWIGKENVIHRCSRFVLSDFISSLTGMTNLRMIPKAEVKSILERNMQDGVLTVPKEYGMFAARK